MDTDINLVLAAYDDAAAGGNARLAEWIEAHPEHRELLTEFAMETALLALGKEAPDGGAEEERQIVRAKTIAEKILAARVSPRLTSLLESARAVGLAPQALADRIGVGIVLLAKLERRMIEASTLPRALAGEIGRTLGIGAAEVAAYFRQPPALSAAASYRSSKTPKVRRENFHTALRDCPGMTDVQKRRWAAETELLDGEG